MNKAMPRWGKKKTVLNKACMRYLNQSANIKDMLALTFLVTVSKMAKQATDKTTYAIPARVLAEGCFTGFGLTTIPTPV